MSPTVPHLCYLSLTVFICTMELLHLSHCLLLVLAVSHCLSHCHRVAA